MLSEKIYRRLLVVYPKEHRREYGELMVQLFRDRMRRDGGGFRGLIVWMQMIFDLAGAAFIEHKEGKEGDKMKKRIGITLVAVLLIGVVGASALFAQSRSETVVSVSVQEADGNAVEDTDGEPSMSVFWQGPDGVAIEEPDSAPEISVVWHETDAVAEDEPVVSMSWQKAGSVATE